MRHRIPGMIRPIAVAIALAGCLIEAPAAARGAFTFYTTQASFDAAEPDLSVQDLQPNTSPAVLASPISSTNNEGYFTGGVLPGISISNLNPALSARGLYLAAGGVGANYFEDSLVLGFAPGVSAVGINAFISNGSALLGGSFTLALYNGSTQLGSETITEPAAPFFLGVSSTTPITSVHLTYNQTEFDGAPYVSRVAFGAAVPEPSSIALMGAGGALTLSLRRRNARRRVP